MAQAALLIVPGRGNSEAGHWQTLIERRFSGAQRVEQEHWETPELDAWSQRIDEVVRGLDRQPLLVAHSFGCLAAAYAQITLGTPVGATLFVAPADPQRCALPERIFQERLRQQGFLVASDNDPWMSHERAIAMANAWGVDHTTLKNGGHINVASGHGRWLQGEAIVARMRRQLLETESLLQSDPALSPRHRGAVSRRPTSSAALF